MPMTYAEHERKKKSPAVCELFSLRDLPEGENIMVRTNGAFVAGYELRGILGYFATDGDRNQTKAMLEALFRSVPDVSMRIQFRYEISERLGDLFDSYVNEQRASQPEVAKYEQQVMYPLAAINQAKSSVTQFENQFSQISNLFHVNVSSATLPQSSNLESLLLSRNAGNVGSVSTQFQSVYGVVMQQNAASAAVRTMTDMTDAQSQDAMKRAIEIDALADAELKEADQMGQQITAAAPGSAPILEAEADVWVVRANAYTQAALAELMRTRGIDLANQSAAAKLATTNNTNNNGLITGALTNR